MKSPLALVVADQAIVSGARLLTQIAVARYSVANSTGIGFYVSTFGFVVLAVMFVESFVTTPINVFLPRQSNERLPRFFADSLRLMFEIVGATGLACLLILAISNFSNWEISQRIATVLLWYLPLHLVREYGRRWMLAVNRNRSLLVFDAVTSVILLIGLAFASQSSWFDATSAFLLTTVANLMFVILWWLQFKTEITFDRVDGSDFRDATRGYGRWVAAEGLFSILLVYFTQWQITSTLGEAEADRYGACLTLVFLANPLLLGITSYFSPRAARTYSEQGSAAMLVSTNRMAAGVVGLLLVLAMVIFVAGDSLMPMIFGQRFQGLGSTVAVLSFGMVMLGISFVYATALQAARAPKLNFIAAILAGTLVVICSLFLLAQSLQGAAWAFLISAAVGALARVLFLNWHLRQVQLDGESTATEAKATGN
jgi:O-antigen/teichoic acid export membrane protein